MRTLSAASAFSFSSSTGFSTSYTCMPQIYGFHNQSSEAVHRSCTCHAAPIVGKLMGKLTGMMSLATGITNDYEGRMN